MQFLFPGEDFDESWWYKPLDGVARLIEDEPVGRFFEPDDFMILAGIRRPPRPEIVLYQHDYTGRHLTLDHTLQAYRYIPPKRPGIGDGRYVLYDDLHEAIEALELWDLPWVKPGLEEWRDGSDWDDPPWPGPDELGLSS